MQTEQIQKVVMADMGTMGASMVQTFATHGYGTVPYNHREAALQKARHMVELNQEALVPNGELSQVGPDAVKARIQLVSDKSHFQDCDIVVESIVKNMQAKHQFQQRISDLTRKGAILTTNTSRPSITEIAKVVQRSEHFCGMYWLNPPHLVPLVEMIKGEKTRDQTARVVAELTERIGEKAVTVKKDAKGSIGNRLRTAILRETLHIVQSGIADVESVDKTVRYGIEFRYVCLSPLEAADFGELDIFYYVTEYLVPDLHNSQEVPALLREKSERGELGMRTGKDFHDYSDDKGERAIRERDEKFIRLYYALYQK